MSDDRYSKMEADELVKLLTLRFGFEPDEINIQFRTDDAKRDALRQFDALSKSDDTGWKEKDPVDRTLLTKDQRAVVGARLLAKKYRLEAKRRNAKRKEKAEEVKLTEAIKESKSGLTPAEIRAEMANVSKLLREDSESE
jgi:hypothetical protein